MNHLIKCYSEVELRLKQISDYIKHILDTEVIIKQLEENEPEYCTSYQGVSHTPIQYNAVIISIYGCYENFIDDILEQYIKLLLSNIGNYEEIPDKIKNKYKFEVLSYLQAPQRYNGYGIEENSAISSLYENVNLNSKDNIILKLAIHHSANLSLKEINQLFSSIFEGKFLKYIKANNRFCEFVKTYRGFSDLEKAETYIKTKEEEKVFDLLYMLLEYRNEVSHSWVSTNRMSFVDVREKLIPFMSVICYSILGFTISCFLENEKHSTCLTKFETIHEIINNKIVCLNTQEIELKLGDFIIIKNSNGYDLRKIIGLQQDRRPVKIANKNTDVGIELDCRIKDSWEYYIF